MTDSRPDSEQVRGAADLIIGALVGSPLIAFVQAIATKSGEDAYARIRRGLSRPERRRADREIRRAGVLTIAVPELRLVVQIPADLSASMAEELSAVRLPRERDGWILIRWGPDRTRWVIEDCDGPPATAITLP